MPDENSIRQHYVVFQYVCGFCYFSRNTCSLRTYIHVTRKAAGDPLDLRFLDLAALCSLLRRYSYHPLDKNRERTHGNLTGRCVALAVSRERRCGANATGTTNTWTGASRSTNFECSSAPSRHMRSPSRAHCSTKVRPDLASNGFYKEKNTYTFQNNLLF